MKALSDFLIMSLAYYIAKDHPISIDTYVNKQAESVREAFSHKTYPQA